AQFFEHAARHRRTSPGGRGVHETNRRARDTVDGSERLSHLAQLQTRPNLARQVVCQFCVARRAAPTAYPRPNRELWRARCLTRPHLTACGLDVLNDLGVT